MTAAECWSKTAALPDELERRPELPAVERVVVRTMGHMERVIGNGRIGYRGNALRVEKIM